MAPKNKRMLTCLDCDKEFDANEHDGVCPHCDLDNDAVLEKDRHQRALDKLKQKRQEESQPKKRRSGLFD